MNAVFHRTCKMKSAEEKQLPENKKKYIGRMQEEGRTAAGLPLDNALYKKIVQKKSRSAPNGLWTGIAYRKNMTKSTRMPHQDAAKGRQAIKAGQHLAEEVRARSASVHIVLSSGWSRSTIGVESGRYVGFNDTLASNLDYQWMSLANV